MCFAEVVEQGHDNHTFIWGRIHHMTRDTVFPLLGSLVPTQQSPEGIQDIQAVLKEPIGAREMESCRCRSSVKVALSDIGQKFIYAGAVYLGQFGLKALDQFFVLHFCSTSIHK